MQLLKNSNSILDKIADSVKGNFKKIKGNLDEKLKKIESKTYEELRKVKDRIPEYELIILSSADKIWDNLKGGFENLYNRSREIIHETYEKLSETKNKISGYGPIVVSSVIKALPYTTPILAGLYVINAVKSPKGKLLGYGLMGLGVAGALGFIMFALHPIHPLPSPNNENMQYLGSPNGYEAFVPNGQTMNYNGHKDPAGDLILDNGNVLHNVIWDGKYSDTIIENHNQIVDLNNEFVGQIDPINHQPYVPLRDFYVIKGQVPIEQVTINGQTYYVIEANKINPANIAGFYTYDKWIPDFVTAMNTPGTYAAGLPGNSPVFQWTNTTGTVAYQTMIYGHYGPFDGGVVLALPNKTIIPYGTTYYPSGTSLNDYTLVQQVYNPPS
jgi:hypothetical protein